MGSLAERQEFFRNEAKPPFAARFASCELIRRGPSFTVAIARDRFRLTLPKGQLEAYRQQ